MQVKYKLYGVDEREQSWKDDIHKLVSDVIPIIESFYNRYDVVVDTITYTSLSSGYASGKLTLDISTDKFYPLIDISLSRLGCGYLKPSSRTVDISCFYENISKETKNTMQEEFGIKSHIFFNGEEDMGFIKSITGMLDEVEKEINKYNVHVQALDLFVF